MTKVNVSATVGEMSATVGELSATVGEMSATVGQMSATVGKFNALKNLRLEIVIHNSLYITSEDIWNNMSKAH